MARHRLPWFSVATPGHGTVCATGWCSRPILTTSIDLLTPYDADTAAWKAALLRCHRSQHERNLRSRGIGFDERILAPERAAAGPFGCHAVESFECFYGPQPSRR